MKYRHGACAAARVICPDPRTIVPMMAAARTKRTALIASGAMWLAAVAPNENDPAIRAEKVSMAR